MKKLLILGFVLTMVLVGAPAFVSAQQWWSGPISTIITITTATLEPSGNTLLIPTYKKYVGDVYALTSGNDILELTLCGFLGPTATEEDVEIEAVLDAEEDVVEIEPVKLSGITERVSEPKLATNTSPLPES